jgi:LEA14-like dessication related protein
LCATLIVLMTAAVACSKPEPPTLVPEKATLVRIDPHGIELAVELTATNPNSVDLTASEITSRLIVGNEQVGTVTLPRTTTLPAGSKTKIAVHMSISSPNIASLAGFAATGNAVPYSVDGRLDMGGALVHVWVPFHFEGSIPHDQIVSAALTSIPGLSR